jgi:hypothetical protein
MDYIQLSAYARSGEGASSRSTHVERDNQVITDLARRTSVIEARKKLSICGLGSASCGSGCGPGFYSFGAGQR